MNSNNSTVYKSMTRILSFCVCCVNILSTREVTMPSSLPRCSSMFWGCWGTTSLSICCRWNSCCSTSWYCRDSILEFWASSTANILWMFSFSWINTQTEMCKNQIAYYNIKLDTVKAKHWEQMFFILCKNNLLSSKNKQFWFEINVICNIQ